jgi:hypothetical protein
MAYGSLVGSVCFTLEVESVKGNEFKVQKGGDLLLKGDTWLGSRDVAV